MFRQTSAMGDSQRRERHELRVDLCDPRRVAWLDELTERWGLPDRSETVRRLFDILREQDESEALPRPIDGDEGGPGASDPAPVPPQSGPVLQAGWGPPRFGRRSR